MTALSLPARLRRSLFQIHLWAGILLALYLTLIGVSGSLLVFENELTQWALPKPFAAPRLPLDELLRVGQRALPDARPTFLSLPQNNLPYARLWLRDGRGQTQSLFVDPGSGQVLTGHTVWIEWVHKLHVNLLLGPRGLVVNGLGAASLLLLTLTGILIGWPGIRRWKEALRLRYSQGRRRFFFDLHRAVGFWTLLFALWWGLSGLYFAFHPQLGRAIEALFPVRAMHPPSVPPDPVTAGAHVPIERLAESALRATPGGWLSGIALPDSERDPVVVYVDRRKPGDFSQRDIHSFGAHSGRLLATWHYGQNQTPGDWILWAMHPLHFGTLWGLGFKILWALAGLALPTLSLTGLWLYWNRKLRFLLRSPSL